MRCCGAAGSGGARGDGRCWRSRRPRAGAAADRAWRPLCTPSTVTVTLGKIAGRPHRPEPRRHHGRRSGRRRRQPADRSLRCRSSARRSAPRASPSTARTRSRSASSTSKCPTTSRGCRPRSRRFTGGGIKVSSVNGRIMLSGTAPDAVTLDKAVKIARQFGPDPINTVAGDAAAAGHAGGALHRSRPPGRAASSACSGTCSATRRWPISAIRLPARNCRSRSRAARFSSRLPARRRRRQRHAGSRADFAGGRRRRAVRRGAVRLSGRPACRTGCRSRVNALEAEGRWPAAWRSPIWWRCRATPRASSPAANFRSRRPARSAQSSFDYKPYGVGLSFTPTVLKDGLINLVDQAGGERDRHQRIRVTVAGTRCRR